MSADPTLQCHALAMCKALKHRCVACCAQCLSAGSHASRRTDAISQHTLELQQCLGTMMYLSEAEMTSSAHHGATDCPMTDTTLSTVLHITTLCEKNVPVSKAVHDVHCTEWCWRLVVHASNNTAMAHLIPPPLPPVSQAGAEVRQVALPLDQSVADTDDALTTSMDVLVCHRVAWCLRAIGNLLACKERRINDVVLRLGILEYCCRVVVLVARLAMVGAAAVADVGFVRRHVANEALPLEQHRPVQPDIVGTGDEAYVWARREMLKQSARTIGNACFGSSPRETTCGAQACKAFVLSTEAPWNDVQDLPTHPTGIGTLGALIQLLRLQDVVHDTVVCRWCLHALNECMYGQTPNRQQRIAVLRYGAHNIVASVLRDVLSLPPSSGRGDDAEDDGPMEPSTMDDPVSTKAQRQRWVLISVGLAALNNLMFRFPCPGPEHYLVPWLPDVVVDLEAASSGYLGASGGCKWLRAVLQTVREGGWLGPPGG